MKTVTVKNKPIITSKTLAPNRRGHFLMGNLKDYKTDPIRLILELQREFGDVARQQLGPYTVTQVAHPDLVKYVLQDNNKNYIRGKFYKNFKLFFGDGLLTTDGDYWLKHRRLAQPIFHRQNVSSIGVSMTAAVSNMLKDWEVYADKQQDFDIVPELMRLSLSILGNALFSIDLGQFASKVRPAVRFGLEAIVQRNGSINSIIPEWVPTPHNKGVIKARQTLDDIVYQVIDEHKRGVHQGRDLAVMLMDARDEETGLGWSDKEIRDELMTIFLAGHETSGTAMGWILYALSKHPEVRRRLEDELESVLGGRTPTVEDLPALPYLKMVVEETLRVYPPIWAYPRDAIADDEIGGFHIPAGSSIFLSPYATHRHPEFWENPEAFDPEHFLPERVAKRHKFAFFPFGGGPRLCIGRPLAMMQLQFMTAMVAQHYHLHAVSGHPVQYGALLSLHPLHGIKMTLHKRRPITRPNITKPAAITPEVVEMTVIEASNELKAN